MTGFQQPNFFSFFLVFQITPLQWLKPASTARAKILNNTKEAPGLEKPVAYI